jgi:hypothetical protein
MAPDVVLKRVSLSAWAKEHKEKECFVSRVQEYDDPSQPPQERLIRKEKRRDIYARGYHGQALS